MNHTAKKIFTLSDKSIEILDGRDKGIYRYEVQYVEAAIRRMAESEKEDNRDRQQEEFSGMLEKLLLETACLKEKIENIEKHVLENLPKEEERREPVGEDGVPEKFRNFFE